MSSADTVRPVRARGGERLLAFAILAALLAALLPVVRVIEPGWWLVAALTLSAMVLAAGYAARRYRLPAVAVTLIEVAVWVVFLTVIFLRDTALLWVIPTLDTFRAVPLLVEAAMVEITVGAAPLEPTLSLAFVVVGSMGLLTIIVDHVVVTARMPLLASVGIVAVSLIPAIAAPSDVDVIGFVFLAVTVLFLLRSETRSREKPLEREAERAAGVPATALGIGAIAIVVAVVATPVLPQPGARAGSGMGPGPGIDATLQLGDDLRRPQEAEVLRVRTDAPSVPYLRATTLSRFDGGIWEPDRSQTVSLQSERAFGVVDSDEDIRVGEYTAKIDVVNLDSQWAPVPYPAVGITGLGGGLWGAVPFNHTVATTGGSTQGQSYEVAYNPPRPSLEQVRAAASVGSQVRDETTQLPADIPPIIGELALQVTADATTDYDRLTALQRWFRGTDFRYSLEAPVEDGFDGSGAEAVAQFLDVRQGYCVHFASAFALMARTLHMPSRIVVGYLPGTPTTETVDGQPVFSVSSSQLHAWPEVFFSGIGWIPFEPTSGLGVPTTFSSELTLPGQPADPDAAPPQVSATPTPRGDQAQIDLEEQRQNAAGSSSRDALDPLPILGAVVAVIVLLALPFLIRELRRRQQDTAARGGDAAAAWQSVQEAAIDVSIAVPASETPRAFAARLVAEHGVAASEMNTVLLAIERASYSRAGSRSSWMGDAAADAATAVRASLLASVPPSRRILALLAPRSLVIRPGSVYAGTTPIRAR
ncbi:transglutaminaseTgpA domain-containing protein [Microbacterium sp. NPDC056569]|uniref:transglutaminase family protein n=1 Tax=Microbacterium sp. NPDC056569 TaxID=3345867 RepID=UPI00366E02D4